MEGTFIAYKGCSISRNIEDYPQGIIIPVDKPYRWTSADVIRKIKFAAGRHFHSRTLKVGHAGTLDPLATGVLLVCIGKATKLAEELQRHTKQYLAGVSFGATTPSYDREKEIDARYPTDGVSESSIRAMLATFIGPQEQVAPLFSAKNLDGVRAYEMARHAYKDSLRNGVGFDHSATELLSRQQIVIPSLELVSFGLPVARTATDSPNPCINLIDIPEENLVNAEILVDCSKGTYIRALARDFGEALGTGAFLNNLRRTRTGSFRVEDALDMEEVMKCLG